MEETKSLYSYIEKHMVGHSLPDDFSLPWKAEDGLAFADGTKDGIAMFHIPHPELDEEEMNIICEALSFASEGDSQNAELLFAKLTERYQAVHMIESIEKGAVSRSDELNANNLYDFANHLLINSPDKELVKVGLIILGLFGEQEELHKSVRTIGLCNEFTLFSVILMSVWENANMEILELAKKVKGWGRIFAVVMIEPENEEIRKWILTEGIHNKVTSAYSALTCYEKAGVEELLQRDTLSCQEFHAIAEIMLALLDEGPVDGFSKIENGEEIFEGFLSHASKMKLTDQDQEIISRIYERIQEY